LQDTTLVVIQFARLYQLNENVAFHAIICALFHCHSNLQLMIVVIVFYWLSNSKVFFKLDSSRDFICYHLNIIVISHTDSRNIDFNSIVVCDLICRHNGSFLIWHKQFRSFFSYNIWLSRIHISSSSFERRWNSISCWFCSISYCILCWIPRVFDWLNNWHHFVFQCCEFWNHIINELLQSSFDVCSCFSKWFCKNLIYIIDSIHTNISNWFSVSIPYCNEQINCCFYILKSNWKSRCNHSQHCSNCICNCSHKRFNIYHHSFTVFFSPCFDFIKSRSDYSFNMFNGCLCFFSYSSPIFRPCCCKQSNCCNHSSNRSSQNSNCCCNCWQNKCKSTQCCN